MTDFNKVSEYLTEAKTFFLATVDGDGVSVRPLGFKMVIDNTLYLGIGTHKDVFKQIEANPNVSLVALKEDGKGWMRIKGALAIDDDQALVDKAFEAAPYLKPMYDENGWKMGILHFEKGTITYYENLMAPVETEEF